MTLVRTAHTRLVNVIENAIRFSPAEGRIVIHAARQADGLLVRAIGDHPDLVLLDPGLPGIDGREGLQAIRSQSDVPVIVVSVRASEREKVACLDAGASDYVTKPFGIQELLARVRPALRQQATIAGPALLVSFMPGRCQWMQTRTALPWRTNRFG